MTKETKTNIYKDLAAYSNPIVLLFTIPFGFAIVTGYALHTALFKAKNILKETNPLEGGN